MLTSRITSSWRCQEVEALATSLTAWERVLTRTIQVTTAICKLIKVIWLQVTHLAITVTHRASERRIPERALLSHRLPRFKWVDLQVLICIKISAKGWWAWWPQSRLLKMQRHLPSTSIVGLMKATLMILAPNDLLKTICSLLRITIHTTVWLIRRQELKPQSRHSRLRSQNS